MRTVFAVSILAILLASTAVISTVDADEGPYVLEMNVGDSFSYVPETNLMDDTTFYVDGPAMAFLSFDGQTLEGTVMQNNAGKDYDCTITAVWEKDNLRQVAYQYIVFKIGLEIPAENVQNVATYGATGWNVTSSPMHAPTTVTTNSTPGYEAVTEQIDSVADTVSNIVSHLDIFSCLIGMIGGCIVISLVAWRL